jgi:hypothetical protein
MCISNKLRNMKHFSWYDICKWTYYFNQLINDIPTFKNQLPSWEWWLDIALQQSTCVHTYHAHTRALTSRLRPLYVTGYSTEAVTYRSHIQCHFPSPDFNMYLINLSIMTSDRRYYSGALSKAVTKYSGLLRFDVDWNGARRFERTRRQCTAFIFNGKRLSNTAAFAVKIRQTGILGLHRCQIARMCHVLRSWGGGGCNDARSNDPRHVISYTDEQCTVAFCCIVWIIHWRKDGAGQFVSTAASVQTWQCAQASGWRRFEKHKTSHGANKLPKI